MQKADAPRPALRVYSRPGCHLCELLMEDLLPLVRGRLDVDLVDVDSRAEWQASFGEKIPVVEFEGRIVCHYHLDEAAIRRIMATQAAS